MADLWSEDIDESEKAVDAIINGDPEGIVDIPITDQDFEKMNNDSTLWN